MGTTDESGANQTTDESGANQTTDKLGANQTTSTSTATTGDEFCEMEVAGFEEGDFYEDAPIGETITVLDPTSVVDIESQKLTGLTINQTQISQNLNSSDDTHFFLLEASFQDAQLDLNELFHSDMDFEYLPLDIGSEPLELKANEEFLVD